MIEAGGLPRWPRPSSSSSSRMRWKERRTRPSGRSRRRAAASPPASPPGRPRPRRRRARSRPRGDGSRGRAGGGRSSPRSRWSKSPWACSRTQSHSSSSTIRRSPGSSTRPGARVDEDHARAAEVAAEAPAGAGPGRRGAGRELAQLRGRVDVAPHPAVEVVFVQHLRREVADVLVDPVAHQPRGRPPVPPGLLPHLLEPGGGDVPVVAHVVVVPDHRGRDRREQPADDRVAPGLLVEPRVLLVVGHLLTRGRVGAAPFADPLPGPRRALVDVDLVAEQEEELGPLVVVVADHLAGEDAERVELLAVGVAVLGLDVLSSWGRATRQEPKQTSIGFDRSIVRIALGGRSEEGSGQRRSPSRLTSYS